MVHALQDLVITLISLLSFPYTLLFGKRSSVRFPNGVATLLHLHVLFLTGASLPTQTHPGCWRKICFCQKKKITFEKSSLTTMSFSPLQTELSSPSFAPPVCPVQG